MSSYQSRDKFLEEIRHDVLAELPQEGRVAEHFLVLPELVQGNPLQDIGVVSLYGKLNIELCREKC